MQSTLDALSGMSLGSLATVAWSYVDIPTVALMLLVFWLTKFMMWHGYLFTTEKLPPGFYGLPFVDVLPYFLFGKQTFFERLENLSKRYGPVLR